MCLKITSISARKIKGSFEERIVGVKYVLNTSFFLEPRLIFAVIPLLVNLYPGNVQPYELLERQGKKRHHSSLIKIFKKLSLFTGKAKRFTEPVGETKHKPAHGLNPSFQAHRPKFEVLKGRVSAHTTTSKHYYC